MRQGRERRVRHDPGAITNSPSDSEKANDLASSAILEQAARRFIEQIIAAEPTLPIKVHNSIAHHLVRKVFSGKDLSP